VGETGLDDFYDLGERRRQGELFSLHLEAAARVKKPIVVHIRDAFDEAFARTAEVGLPGGGVVHCFTGGPAECARAVELGYHISLSGMATFKSAKDLRAAVPLIPRDRLLVETDSPYLAPVPHRGKRNEPAFVVDTALQVAALRGESLEELAAYTTANARRLFNLPG
jgi:TatD DNase family protein